LLTCEGQFFAIDNTCTHEACPLSEGDLDGFELTCACHGSQFDVRTGAVVSPPALVPTSLHAVRVEGGVLVASPRSVRVALGADHVGSP
jgi:nitrite reductase/ring-hydroxylating ferredoxin subunit